MVKWHARDVQGWLGIWDIKSFRPRLFWKAHAAGILSIEEYSKGIITLVLPSPLSSLFFLGRKLMQCGI